MNNEIRNKAIELTDEQVEKASGGATIPIEEGDVVVGTDKTVKCPSCLKTYTYVYKTGAKIPPCPYCGYERYDPTTPHSNGGTPRSF